MSAQRPSLANLNSVKLKRSDSQKIQTTFFPTRLTVELEKVTDKLNKWKTYIGKDSNNDDEATYTANTKMFLREYSRMAKTFLGTVFNEDSNSYERFCLSIYMSRFHESDYNGMLSRNLPPTYDSLDTNRLFLPVANLDNIRKKIGLRGEIEKLLTSYSKMEQIMNSKVQAWVAEVVEKKTRIPMPLKTVSSIMGVADMYAFREAVYESVGV
jgi:hypothetical protein